MKTIYKASLAGLIIFSCCMSLRAATIVVAVGDFQFSPPTFTIAKGDTIVWMWDNNATTHTTTSTVIPTGAAPWDQQLNQNSPFFMYIPAVMGTYDYECSLHASMGMYGHFTVSGTTGISSVQSPGQLSMTVTSSPSHELLVVYSIPSATAVSLRLYDLLGKVVGAFSSVSQSAGTYSQSFALPTLTQGLYILKIETDDGFLSRRVLIQ